MSGGLNLANFLKIKIEICVYFEWKNFLANNGPATGEEVLRA